MEVDSNTPEQEFFVGEGAKTIYLNAATRQAQLTKPTCCPPNISDPPPQSLNQSTGADTTDRLANQLMTTIFPAIAPICHVVLPEGADPEEIRKASVAEAAINYAFWNSKLPLVIQDLIKLAIVTSDAVAVLNVKEGVGKTYPLRDYIKLLTHSGILDTLIVRDFISLVEADEFMDKGNPSLHKDPQGKYWKHWYLYTRYKKLESGDYQLTTCTTGNPVMPEDTETIKAKDLEVLHIEWETNHAGSYGVGCPVQQAYVDLVALGKMQQALTNQLNGAVKHMIGIDPTAPPDCGKDVRTGVTGSTVVAAQGQIYPIQQYDPKAVEMWMNAIPVTIQRIETIMGVAGGQQRDAERVTAAEVQATSQNRVGKHGGFYLRMEEYILRPLVKMLVQTFIKKPEMFNFKTASGYAASLQYPNAQALQNWVTVMSTAVQQSPQIFESTLNIARFGNLLAAALNVNLSTAYLTGPEKQEQEQKAQEAQIRDAALQQAQKQPLEQQPEGMPNG